MRLVPAALRAESRLTNLSQANQWSLPTSASLDRFPENVRIGAVVIPELELGHIEGQILGRDPVESADNAAFEDASKAFNRLGVGGAANVLALCMVNNPVRVLDGPAGCGRVPDAA
jgi:hypothetical protein